jgi:predicted dehydrogenase
MGKLKVGVIGAGAIAKNHVQGYRNAGAEILAICDVNPAALEKAKAEMNIPLGVTDLRDILGNKDIEAVSVCTPNFLHCEMTVAALKAGKHVLCEKPMALDPKQAETMVKAAAKADRILMLGHNNRFTPEVQQVNRMREQGVLGEVYHAKASIIRRRGIPGLGGWFTTRAKSGGGPLIDIGIHAIDRAWYMMGKPKPVAVSGICYNKFGCDIAKYVCVGMWAGPRKLDGIMDVEDFAAALVRFENGATMQVEVSWACNREDEPMKSVIMGDKAGIILVNDDLTLFSEADNMLTTQKVAFDKTIYKDRHQHFVDCVTKGVTCTCPGADGLAMQKVLYGIQASSDQGKEVRL